jgi:hypothetical protein
LQDLNGKGLATSAHGNRLVNANISTVDQLKELEASPATKDQLRRTRTKELVPPYLANTEFLDQYLREDENMKNATVLEEVPCSGACE